MLMSVMQIPFCIILPLKNIQNTILNQTFENYNCLEILYFKKHG